MANNLSIYERIGLTRGKAAIIVALAVALVGVVYIQYGGSDLDNGAAGASSSASRGRATGPATERRSPVGRRRQQTIQEPQAAEPPADDASLAILDQSRWSSPDLALVIAYDPFALPAAFPRPPQEADDPASISGQAKLSEAGNAQRLAQTVERLQRQLEELQRRGVHVILNDRDEYVAMIGDRTIHIGDEIDDFTVTAIDLNGVRVEKRDLE